MTTKRISSLIGLGRLLFFATVLLSTDVAVHGFQNLFPSLASPAGKSAFSAGKNAKQLEDQLVEAIANRGNRLGDETSANDEITSLVQKLEQTSKLIFR